MINEWIGWEGLGNSVEFTLITETEKAFHVVLVDDEDIKMWIPKSAFLDDGALSEYGITLFHEKYNKYMKDLK